MVFENDVEKYILSRWSYLCGEYLISDVEYDKLEKWYKETYPDDVYSTRPWSLDECPTELLNKYHRTDLIIETTMGYMAESIPSLNDENSFYEVCHSINEKTRVSFKIDGWNCRVSYYNGVVVKVETRGRSGNNLDISGMYKLFPKSIPYKGRVAITGELNIPNSKWLAFKLLTGNSDQRSSVRTAIAQNLYEYLSFLAFNIFSESETLVGDSYDILKSLGFKSPMCKYVYNFSQLKSALNYFSAISKKYPYLTDGLVVENSTFQNAVRLGAWEEEVMCSYVVGYEESQGMYGNALIVDVFPITVEGRTFPKVSVVNIATIVENNLKIGSPIAFNLRSSADVVFDVTETTKLQRQWNGRYDEYVTHIQEKVKH